MAQLSNEQIGQNVMNLRESSGMSMDKLANVMRERGHKWTRVTVFNIEHGERMLKFQEAVDLLDALHLEPTSGMKRLMTESEEYRLVQNEVFRVAEDLEDLTNAIFSLRMRRRHLDVYLKVINTPVNAVDHNYDDLRQACENLDVEFWVRNTSAAKIIGLTRDLLAVPLEDLLAPSVTADGIGRDDIGIFKDENHTKLEVVNEMTGKEYRADNVGPDESIIKD